MGAKKINSCEIITIDFKTKSKTSSVVVSSETPSSSLDMSGFNEPQGNFKFFSEQELHDNSEHILNNIQDLSLEDIIHFVQVGSLDKKKLSHKLGLREE